MATAAAVFVALTTALAVVRHLWWCFHEAAKLHKAAKISREQELSNVAVQPIWKFTAGRFVGRQQGQSVRCYEKEKNRIGPRNACDECPRDLTRGDDYNNNDKENAQQHPRKWK